MTETQVAGTGKNFLVAGYREVGRMFSRFSLRQTMNRQEAERAAALTAVGQRAWDQQVDLSAFAELRDQLALLDARAGEISQATSKLQSEKSALDEQRRAQAETFAAKRREVEAKKAPVDTALAAARAEKRAADESRLVAESQQLASQIAAIDAELRTSLGPIDAALSRLQAELGGASAQASATEKDRGATLMSLGTKLYESGAGSPALAGEFEKVAAIGKARRDTESALHDSLAVTQTLAPGTMAKFWLVVVGVPLVLVVLLNVVQRQPTPGADSSPSSPVASNAPVELPTPTRSANPDDDKRQVIELFVHRAVMGRDDSDEALHAGAVAILKRDIDTLGASGQPEYLPMLTKVLASPDPELRAAAADSIGMIGPTDAETPALSKLLNDTSPEVAKAAKRALAAPRAR